MRLGECHHKPELHPGVVRERRSCRLLVFFILGSSGEGVQQGPCQSGDRGTKQSSA